MTNFKPFSSFTLIVILAVSGLTGCGGGGGKTPVAPAAPAPAAAPAVGRIAGAVYTGITINHSGGADVITIPLPEADVQCEGAAGKTDTLGRFSILAARSGSISCTITREGFTPQNFQADLAPGGAFNATAAVLFPQNAGTVEIAASGAAAAVAFDGLKSPLLTTGVFLSGVSAGAHSVAVASEGFETAASQTVSVAAGATATVTFNLVKKTISLDIAWDGKTVIAGETLKLAASCRYFDGTAADCTAAVAWDSSNRAVGTVTDAGSFTAVSPGETKITATRVQSRITHPGVTVKVVCPEGTSWTGASCTGDSLTALSVSPGEVRIDKGGSAVLAAACTWRFAGSAPCPELSWNSSNPGAAAVDSTGAVTGKAAGTAVITASGGNITSNIVPVTVIETQAPDPTCEGTSNFCLDIAGAAAGADGRVEMVVGMSGPPAAGLGTGIITLTWTPGALVYITSAATGAAIGFGDSKEDGRFTFVFTSPVPLAAGGDLFTVTFSQPPGPAAPVQVKIDRAMEATNFTDFGLNLISQSGIVFRDGYAGR